MADQSVSIQVNDKPLQLALRGFSDRIRKEPLLRIAGEVLRGSIMRTFSDEGSPAGSWAPLAASTLKRRKGSGPFKKLMVSGRLRNSITYQVVGDKLIIGTNLKYAAIHQRGGNAGRRGPFKKANGRRPHIPARPYLVFRPEDPQRIQQAMEAYIASQAKESGL